MKSGPRKFELTADVSAPGLFDRRLSDGREPRVDRALLGRAAASGAYFRSTASSCRAASPRRCARTGSRSSPTATFAAVMRACAERDSTWINDEILRLYGGLHDAGHAHSIEVYEDGALVGGLYGVSLRSVFFGESMFHRARDASKVALVHLVARLQGRRLSAARHAIPHRASGEPRRGRRGARRFPAHAGRIAEDLGRFLRHAGGPGDAGRRGSGARPRHGSCEANRDGGRSVAQGTR